MAITWQNVFSDVTDRVGYDAETQTMYVPWSKTGKISRYHDVSPQVFEQTANAYSVGNFLHESIKPNYKHSYHNE